MTQAIKKFLLHKSTIVAIGVAILYQLIMIGVMIPGYSSIPKHMDKLPIAIVNEDVEMGSELISQLKEALPVNIVDNYSLSDAKEALDQREIYLLIHIPEDYTAKLIDPSQQVTIHFYMNEASQAITSSTMSMFVGEISGTLTAQIQAEMMQGVFTKMQMPDEQAKAQVEAITTKFNPNVITINEVRDGMHNQLAPLFLNIANNISALMVSLILVKSLNRLRPQLGKWKSFVGFFIAILIVAIVAPLGGLAIFFSVENYGLETFFTMWGIHSLTVLASSLIFLSMTMLLGEFGLIFNLTFVFTQIISGTGILPQEVLYPFFDTVRVISPMYYAVQADFTTLFGGSSFATYLTSLGLFVIVGLLMIMIVQAIIPKNRQPRESIL